MSGFLMSAFSRIALIDGMIHGYIRTVCHYCFEMRIDDGFWTSRIDNVRGVVDGVVFSGRQRGGVICSRWAGSSYYKSFQRKKMGYNKGLRN